MEFLDAIELLVEGHQAQGNFKSAIQYARQWQALDPLNEKAQRKLMRLYAWSGQRSAAIAQYHECERLLMEELNVSPEEATILLFKEISQEHGPPRPAVSTREPSRQVILSASNPNSTFPIPLDSSSGVAVPTKSICVAREPELAHLNRFLDAMLAGQGRPFFIIGSPGQGKTNLLQAFTHQAQERSEDLLYAGGNCNAFSGFGDPYLPFREILGLLTGDVDALWAAGSITQEHARRLWEAFPLAIDTIVNYGPDLVETLLPGRSLFRRATAFTAGSTPDQSIWLPELEKLVAKKVDTRHDPNLVQAALFEQYTRVIATLAKEKPILITLDDLQWADNGSISLLFHLGRRLEGKRVLILCAYRPEEVAMGKAGERHPLELVIHQFQQMYDGITIDLSKAESRSFVDAYIDSEPNRLDEHFRRTIYRKTEGHPLFTIELLRGMEERGDLVLDEEGNWIEGESLDWEILPGRIEAVIAERISRLDDSLKELLRIACVEGEIFSAEVIAHVLSIDERQVVEQLSTQLEHKHRLIRAQEMQRLGAQRLSRYRFRHFLFQYYLYQSLDPIERALQHEAVGMALEALYQETTMDIAMSLSRHFQEAGNIEKAVTYLFMAGEKAVRSSDHETAITLYSRGLELLGSLPQIPEHHEKKLRFLIALGLPLVLTKGHSADEVEKTYKQALDLCEMVGDNLQKFQILLGLRRYHLHRGNIPQAGVLGESLLQLVQDMPDSIHFPRAHTMQGEILYRMGEFNRAIEHCKKGIAADHPSHSQEQIFIYGNDCGATCRAIAALTLWHLGYPCQALNYTKEVLSLIHQLSHPFTMAVGLYFSASLFIMQRDTQAVRTCIDELMKISREKGFSFFTALGFILQGWIMAQGDLVMEGIQTMQKGLVLWHDVRAKLMLPTFLIFIAEAQRKVGNYDEGMSLLNQAQSLIKDTGERTYEAELYRCQGEMLLLKERNQTEAESKFLKALQVARIQNARSWELRAAVSLSRLWMNQDKLAEARLLLSEVYDWFTEGFDTPDMQEARALLDRVC